MMEGFNLEQGNGVRIRANRTLEAHGRQLEEVRNWALDCMYLLARSCLEPWRQRKVGRGELAERTEVEEVGDDTTGWMLGWGGCIIASVSLLAMQWRGSFHDS